MITFQMKINMNMNIEEKDLMKRDQMKIQKLLNKRKKKIKQNQKIENILQIVL